MSDATLVYHFLTDTETSATTLSPRSWRFTTKSEEYPCNDQQKKFIEREIGYARQHLEHTIKNLHLNGYYETFFAKDLRDKPTFDDQVITVYKNIDRMLDKSNNGYEMKFTCQESSRKCKDGYLAHMLDAEKRINFCNKFFKRIPTPKDVYETTDDKLASCDQLNLRGVQFTPSAVLIHECTHTRFAMAPNERQVPIRAIP